MPAERTNRMAEAEKQPTKKSLHLVFPVNGTHVYTVGENCDSIIRLADGGYEVAQGPDQYTISPERVAHYFQSPRPGYAEEQRNAEKPLPAYAEALEDGTFLCKACNHTAKSLHALKVHHGKAHQD